ncbi:hypothetical protein CFRS1_v011213 [Colletotrichum fructicola]|uniref:Uncharacterized protein n=1 Tax=Colletotrichum fructicola (strain Nara gc5) TaxID=1213859 RepID=L2G5Z6_COLFN|nr:hypothetical protein CFRS1_v011213 [Colletotrichum fructicola]
MEVTSFLEGWRRASLSNEVLEHTINLAVSVWLMIKLGPVSEQEGPWRRLRWREGSLQDCIHEHFNKKPSLNLDGIRLPRSFNAWSIEKIGGVEIEFTDNLDDHLFLSEDNSGMKVQIFHHANFLQHFQSSMFPEGLLAETLDTLKLVFPQSEFGRLGGFKCKRRKFLENLWLKSREREIDTSLGSCGTLQAEARRIEKFNFWRDRLIVLKQAYDEKTPSSLPQWWYDRRNRVVWSTFWIAILVLVLSVAFGIVQCVQGGIQASKA